jgi:hypothetical protein
MDEFKAFIAKKQHECAVLREALGYYEEHLSALPEPPTGRGLKRQLEVDSSLSVYEDGYASPSSESGANLSKKRIIEEVPDSINVEESYDTEEENFKASPMRILNGKGKKTSPDGGIQEGEFKNGKLNGYGKTTYPGEQIQEGEFKNDMLDGKGKITFSDGYVKEGEFKDNEMNGKGKTTSPDGQIEEGEFKNGELNGNGK